MNITVSNLTKHYSNNRGVTNLDFTIEPGEVVGLIGLNGSGKTTTMKLLSGLLEKEQGEISIFGHEPKDAKSLIAFHGEKDILYPWLTPKDVEKVMSALYPDFDNDRFQKLLIELEVPDGKNKNMSKGQKSRFRLALTLARKAKLYILDEPLSGIDVISRRKIIKTLISEWRDDAAMLISTHEIEAAQNLFESVIILKDGEIAVHDKTEKLRESGKDIVDIFEEVVSNERD